MFKSLTYTCRQNSFPPHPSTPLHLPPTRGRLYYGGYNLLILSHHKSSLYAINYSLQCSSTLWVGGRTHFGFIKIKKAGIHFSLFALIGG